MFLDFTPQISPAMKVGEFLTLFPELEEDLIALSPVFVKLRNPVLRRTIARVTTLKQASVVGSIPLEQMINTLRQKAGQPILIIENEQINIEKPMEKPDWLHAEKITISLDARPILASGDHPLDRVLRETRTLNPGEIYEIITPFPPMPMIEKIEATGFTSYMEQEGGTFRTYFRK